jgi:predicted ATP-binding protein involved in virulence
MQIKSFKLKNIHLENYKKYSDLSFGIKNDFTLIIGENGAGKTTVLDGIATILGGFLQSFKSISSVERHSILKSDIKIEIVEESENIYIKYPTTPIRVSGVCDINGSKIPIKRKRNNANKTTMTSLLKTENSELFSLVKELENSDDMILPILSYHGTGRLWEQEYKKSSKMEKLTRYDGYKDCLNAKSNYRNFISWFEKQERNAFNLRKTIPILEAVRNIVIKMLELLTKKEIELFIYRENDLEIKFKNNDKRERVSNLSAGYRDLIGIVSDIAYRMAILNPHLGVDVVSKTSGIVLIDEIDLHLHPKWQREIISILRQLFPLVQFIATTHSPFVIQSISKDSLIKISDEASMIQADTSLLSIEDISEDIQNIELPQVSKRKIEMLEVADKYLDYLEKLDNNNISKEEVKNIKQNLDKLIEPFEDNMAYVAFLRRKRLVVENATDR